MLSMNFSGCVARLLYTSVAENKSLEVGFPLCRNLLYQEHCTGICNVIGAFAKLRKETIGFVMPLVSICPFVRPHGTTRLLLDRYS